MFRKKIIKYGYPAPVLTTQFLCQAVYPENPDGTQVIVGSMNMGYDSNIQHCQDSNSQPILSQACAYSSNLSHSDGQDLSVTNHLSQPRPRMRHWKSPDYWKPISVSRAE